MAWHGGEHDDLVLAALAAWLGEQALPAEAPPDDLHGVPYWCRDKAPEIGVKVVTHVRGIERSLARK